MSTLYSNSTTETTGKPARTIVKPENIPASLTKTRQWVIWKYEFKPAESKPWTKVPYMPAGDYPHAASNRPTSWHHFESALAAYKAIEQVDGIGFMLHHWIPVIGLDLDNCIVGGTIEPWAVEIINRLNSYSEFSPSGKGIRIFALGQLPDGRRKTGKDSPHAIEMYNQWRFLTVTGQHVAGTPTDLTERTEEIAALHAELFPAQATKPDRKHGDHYTPPTVDTAQIVEVATAAKNGQEFRRLWDGKWAGMYQSESDADLGLATRLAFYCGPDTDRVDAVFRESPYYQGKDPRHLAKWDRADYRANTLAKATAGDQFYRWPGSDLHAADDEIDRLFDQPAAQDGYAEPDQYCASVPTATKDKPQAKDRRIFEDANFILTLPDPVWTIDGILMDRAIGLIWGWPGCLKTFFGLDMALSLAHGLPFLDQFPIQNPDGIPVAYISPEGTLGLKQRLRGWMNRRGIDTLRNTHICRHAFNLTDPDDARQVITQLAAAKCAPKYLFIDTLARNFGGGDEDKTKDMNGFVNNVMDIAAELELGAIIVHHAGKDKGKGARGSMALTGAVDLSIEMDRPFGSNVAAVKCHKQKDGEQAQPFDVVLEKDGGPALRYQQVSHTPGENEKEITLKPILLAMADHPMTAAAIEKAAGIPHATAYRLLRHAVDGRLLTKAEDKTYSLTDTGIAKRDSLKILEMVSP